MKKLTGGGVLKQDGFALLLLTFYTHKGNIMLNMVSLCNRTIKPGKSLGRGPIG
jgi:hypothetical protein